MYTHGRRIDRVGVESSITEWQTRANPPHGKVPLSPSDKRNGQRWRVGKGREEGKGGENGGALERRATNQTTPSTMPNRSHGATCFLFFSLSFSSFSLLFSFAPTTLCISVFSRFARHACWRSPLAKIETLNCVISSRLKWPFPLCFNWMDRKWETRRMDGIFKRISHWIWLEYVHYTRKKLEIMTLTRVHRGSKFRLGRAAPSIESPRCDMPRNKGRERKRLPFVQWRAF